MFYSVHCKDSVRWYKYSYPCQQSISLFYLQSHLNTEIHFMEIYMLKNTLQVMLFIQINHDIYILYSSAILIFTLQLCDF